MNNAIPIALTLLVCHLIQVVDGDDSYQSIKTLHDTLFSQDSYSTVLPPIRNQSEPITVFLSFSLVAIVSVDNVRQELVTNGFIFMKWKDQNNEWDPSDYNGYESMIPDPSSIWRPRLLLINTLQDRYPFQDKFGHAIFQHSGDTVWVPGGLFHTYCYLNMEKFPFDVQECKIQMCPMGHSNRTMRFIVQDTMGLAFFYPNPGWDLVDNKVSIENISLDYATSFSCPTFIFKLRRRWTNIVLNVILPILALSMLNNLVFFIPIDSGEKISYAITVLLSLAVFMSMVSTMTPQVSDVVPALTIYLSVMMFSSVFTVMAAIFTVYLYHKKSDAPSQTDSSDDQIVSKKIASITPDEAFTEVPIKQSGNLVEPQETRRKLDVPRKKHDYDFKLISKYVDIGCFLLLTTVLIVMTLWYFTTANS